MNSKVEEVTRRIIKRSESSRTRYLEQVKKDHEYCKGKPVRHCLPCSNLAHAMASASKEEKTGLFKDAPNIGIITAYNDMLSAHCPYAGYPEIIKEAVLKAGGVAQVAGGVPAMCDGITQGEPGMDLSLMSRDVIAMSVAISLSHNVFDGVLLLGVCDKIVPGLLMGALQFGHLPMALVPAGPMPSGIPNREKAKARELFAQGKINRSEMLAIESKAYHGPGTCTFYGTANSNQLLAEVMGLHLPGASFVQPGTPLRQAFTTQIARRICDLTRSGGEFLPIGELINEKAIVNAIVALLATGGSTNQTMHIVAVARAAGIVVNWDDFSDLSDVVPFIVKIYPNGPDDINGFQKAGGIAALVAELLKGGFLHEDVNTIAGYGLEQYSKAAYLENGEIRYSREALSPRNFNVISTIEQPFDREGGLKVLSGNLGRAVIKTSPLKDGSRTVVEAPAVVFNDQHELYFAFERGELNRDMVAVVRYQGPRANGMPELHKLITPLSIIMDRGYDVALVTDGRLSGASGKVPSAIHVNPEAFCGGLLSRVCDGDIIRLDVEKGLLELKVSDEELEKRPIPKIDLRGNHFGLGRQIFSPLRRNAMKAEEGASSIFTYDDESHAIAEGKIIGKQEGAG